MRLRFQLCWVMQHWECQASFRYLYNGSGCFFVLFRRNDTKKLRNWKIVEKLFNAWSINSYYRSLASFCSRVPQVSRSSCLTYHENASWTPHTLSVQSLSYNSHARPTGHENVALPALHLTNRSPYVRPLYPICAVIPLHMVVCFDRKKKHGDNDARYPCSLPYVQGLLQFSRR